VDPRCQARFRLSLCLSNASLQGTEMGLNLKVTRSHKSHQAYSKEVSNRSKIVKREREKRNKNITMASLNVMDNPTNDPPGITNNYNTTPNPININTPPASRHLSFASDNNLLATETTTDKNTNNRSGGILVGFTMPPRQQNQTPITLTPDTEQHPTNNFLLPHSQMMAL